jgi:hypothetical protein
MGEVLDGCKRVRCLQLALLLCRLTGSWAETDICS